MKRLIAVAGILILLLIFFSYVGDRFSLNLSPKSQSTVPSREKVKVLSEESVVTSAVKKVGPSVVTIIENVTPQQRSIDLGPFSIFGLGPQTQDQTPQPQSIGSGFVVDASGLVVTNKHVVSDASAKYQIITSNDKKYSVNKIYRDPLNDVAVLKVNTSELRPVELGDSSRLEVGQFVIAIGTALGQFRNTVTTGVISGLGRGITAGSAFEGFAEKLDNVIQTDAAINPGNSGGPLLNSSSQVIGVNTAIASSAQNIGFALPVNVIKNSLDNFNKSGQFNRAYLGVSYRTLDKEIASLNDLPAGGYIESVVVGSPAEHAGIQRGDIITHYNGKRIEKDKFEISAGVSQNKVGEPVSLKIWRDGKTTDVKVTLGVAPDQ